VILNMLLDKKNPDFY